MTPLPRRAVNFQILNRVVASLAEQRDADPFRFPAFVESAFVCTGGEDPREWRGDGSRVEAVEEAAPPPPTPCTEELPWTIRSLANL